MSDSEDSTVTYTEISSPYEDLSDVGSPGAEGPIFQDPPSPDYVPGPEEPVAGTTSPFNTIVFQTWYIPESDPEEDPEEDNEEDPEEDPADYPADRGDDRDDEESSDDDDDCRGGGALSSCRPCRCCLFS
ncbi:hypothetical protein Tco_0749102 [Tanacetum coccineum]|uniref:Uncharacterized protein n=1 Tax=Tanacetum coccineum TaxID=301880 RepID=A0ABQ4Z010_9ASTR